jgi:hypothetical protein
VHCPDDLSVGMTEGAFGDVRFGGSVKRIGNYAAHKARQADTSDPSSPNYNKKISAGPMESEDGKFMVGSCFIIEATREAVEAFIAGDIFKSEGVWDAEKISINRYTSFSGIKAVEAVNDGPDLTTVRMVASKL